MKKTAKKTARRKKRIARTISYDPAKIEKKWQKKWESSKIYKTKEDVRKKKFYVLDMFPYPSGEGLHVGHPKGYIATDAISRYHRMKGDSVLHPMGFDAFGLPAENYALKTKTNPADSVKKNVARFKKQLELIGLDYDWSREVNTTDPKYYKWTQWIFLQLFKKGLAYESFEPINWCPSCKTGLANEDVENGLCERCGTVVEKKPMRQWVLRITDYAERLLNDLDATDYVMPKLIDKVNPHQPGKPLVKRFVAHAIVYDPKTRKFLIIRNKKHGWDTVVIGGVHDGESVVDTAIREVREETGYVDIEFKSILGGATEAHYYAKHKGENRVAIAQAVFFELKSDKRVPIADGEDKDDEIIWIDKKDFVPGKMVNSELPIWLERLPTAKADFSSKIPCFTQTLEPGIFKEGFPVVERNAIMAIVKHWSEDKYIGLKWKKVDWQTLITGGIEKGQTAEQAAIAEIAEETGYLNPKLIKNLGKMDSRFFHVPKNVNRLAHFDVLYFELKDGKRSAVSGEEQSNHEVVWVNREDVGAFVSPMSHKYAWNTMFSGKQMDLSNGEARHLLDWPESIKELQRNWIGRSEGALIRFGLAGKKEKSIEAFTTRPDTLFGVTYIVLAPEHKSISDLLGSAANKPEIEEYIKKTKSRTEIQRTDDTKEKTGVELKGVKAINPANNEEVPIFIADYVLADYGTGAVMAVPAHDKRDWDFAKRFNLPKNQVIVPYLENKRSPIHSDLPIVHRKHVDCIIYNPKTDKFAALKWNTRYGWTTLIGGGIEDGEDVTSAGKREATEESGFKNIRFVKEVGKCVGGGFAAHKNENRRSDITCLYFELIDEERSDIDKDELSKHEPVWLSKGEMSDFLNVESSEYLWNLFVNGNEAITGEGIIINSGQFNGKESSKIMRDITVFAGGKWVTKYKLRDWVFSRQRYWGEPIPLIHCDKCGIVPVPEKDLPVILPRVRSYEPTGTGESPLAAISKWVNVKCPNCGNKGRRETNTMPQWAGSCWYYLRYEDPDNSKKLVDQKKERYWSPVDIYVGGAEHATRHLIYARFWHKFLFDIGAVSMSEPFIKLQHVGLIIGEDGKKMSKRSGNVVNPDDIIKAFGADTLRLYEMFMGPFDQQISWNTSSMVGCRRFIEKIWKLDEKIGTARGTNSGDVDRLLHKTIKKVTGDIECMRFNTAISSLMILVNDMEKATPLARGQYGTLLQLLAPFAPHVTEELWSKLGNKRSIHASPWPEYDPALAADAEATIIVQVNGRVRGSFTSAPDTSKEDMEKKAQDVPGVKKWLEGKKVIKIIVVPGRLVNIVVP
jgi:leucyl-tRNA synthetase